MAEFKKPVIDRPIEYNIKEARCLCIGKSSGLILCAAIPFILLMSEIALILSLVFGGKYLQSFTALMAFSGGAGLDLGALFVLGVIGLLAMTFKRKLLFSIWIILSLVAAVFIVVAGFDKAYIFTATFFKEIQNGTSNIQKNLGPEKENFVKLATGVAQKGAMIGRGFILASIGIDLQQSIVLYFLLLPEFAAFAHGTFPALIILVTAAFVYTIAQDSGLNWPVRRSSKRN